MRPERAPFLPDQLAATAHDDYTGTFQNIQCYDGLKVEAILNEIDRKHHDGTYTTRVANIFGMNFQAVSIGQKLIYQHGAVATGYSTSGCYTDSIGTPSASLKNEIEFIDQSIGMMVAELKKQGLSDSMLVIVTAKHGQSPVDTSRYQAMERPTIQPRSSTATSRLRSRSRAGRSDRTGRSRRASSPALAVFFQLRHPPRLPRNGIDRRRLPLSPASPPLPLGRDRAIE